MNRLSTPVRWVIGATLAMAAAMGVGRFAYTPLLPEMSAAFAWTYGQAGDVASANFLGYLAGALLAPFVARAPAVRLYVAFSFMASVATTYLGAEVTDYELWLALRFASGIASAFCLVVLTAHLLETLYREQALQLGNVHFAGVGLGILLCMGGVFMGGTVAEQWARQGLIAALCMALAWFLIGPGPWRAFAPPGVDDTRNTADSGTEVMRTIVGYGLFGFGYVVSATFVVAMGERLGQAGFDPRTTWVVVGASTIPSVYLWQWFAQRQSLGLALRCSYWVLAVGACLAGLAWNMPVLLLAAMLLGGTFGGVTALGLSAGRALAPERVAWIVSAMTVAFSVGQLLGPAVAGRMADMTGGFLLPSLLAGGLVALAALLVPRHPSIER